MIPQQVQNLQNDGEFRAKCRSYYANGYKDWVITMAVFNCMIQWQGERVGVDLRNPRQIVSLSALGRKLANTTYPTWRFLEEDMAHQLTLHSFIVLQSYGFEPRRADFRPEVVERFLRERMRHFELDLPHQPLFGEPPGDWPEV